MADIAAVFHWPLSELRAFSIGELVHWRRLAIEKWNEMNRTE